MLGLKKANRYRLVLVGALFGSLLLHFVDLDIKLLHFFS